MTRTAKSQIFSEILKMVGALGRSPRALWGVAAAYFIEGIAYFGFLTLLMKYLSENIALGDITAGVVVALFTGGVTFAMFFLGDLGERYGLRRVLLISLMLMALGRAFMTAAGYLSGGSLVSPAFLASAASLLIVAVGFGIFQPALFAAVKQFSAHETSAVAFAVVYGLNSLGAFVAGLASPHVRTMAAGIFPPNGINGMFAACAVLTFVSVAVTATILTPRAATEAAQASRQGAAVLEKTAFTEARPRVLSSGWIAKHPLREARFSFFIFIFIPVQTLFAHNWLTLPLYINRAFVPWVADRFELFSNLGPLLIFVLAPLVAALTASKPPLSMMVWGTLVMALPAFLLALGPSPAGLITYIVLMTVGESMWQPRFYHYLTELAPPGRVGAYVGIGQLPWFLTKLITGLYAGWFLQRFCPAEGPQSTEQMWLIFACLAMVSPVALLATRRWLARNAH